MNGKSLDPETYEKLRQAFADQPGNINSAAQSVGVNWRTAKKAWERGYPKQGIAAIRDLQNQEKLIARKQLAQAQEERKTKEQAELSEARSHAIESRKQEGQMVNLVRAQSMQNLAAALSMAAAARHLAPILKEAVEMESRKIKAWTQYENALMDGKSRAQEPRLARSALSAEQAAGLLQRVARFSKECADVARQAMEMERLHLGQPTEILGVMEGAREYTLAEAQARLAAMALAVQEASASASLIEVDGQLAPRLGERVEG